MIFIIYSLYYHKHTCLYIFLAFNKTWLYAYTVKRLKKNLNRCYLTRDNREKRLWSSLLPNRQENFNRCNALGMLPSVTVIWTHSPLILFSWTFIICFQLFVFSRYSSVTIGNNPPQLFIIQLMTCI